MKVQIEGFEASALGALSKAGKPYDIGQIYTTIPLAPPFSDGGIAKGRSGTSYRCASALVRGVAHLPVPFMAEMEVQDVNQFGKREQIVISVIPEKLVAKPA